MDNNLNNNFNTTYNDNFNGNPIPPQPPVDDKKGMAIAILVLGIVSIVCCLCGCSNWIPAATAIVLYCVNKDEIAAEHQNMAKAGFICGIVAAALGFIMSLVSFFSGFMTQLIQQYS